MQSLFRPEAVAHATGRLDGSVLLPAPVAAWGVIAIAVAILGLGAWFATSTTYTRHETVPGWLSPQGGVTRVVTGRAGQSISRDGTDALVADDELIAELLVPPHVVGLVATGQTLSLHYDGLLLGRRLVQHGTVTHISRAPLGEDEIGNSGIPVTGSVYRVRVRLPAQRMDTGDANVQLRAGMLLNAQIAGHRRTLFESLFRRHAGKP